jgi:antirestriction protein ArdC
METIYLTYEQWNRLGFKVKKGEKATKFKKIATSPSLKFSEQQVNRSLDYDYEEDYIDASESDIY